MGPPRETIKYAPVEQYSAKTTETPVLESSEVRHLLRETEAGGQLWRNKMVSPDKQTGVGAKPPVDPIPDKSIRNDPPLRWQQIMGCLAAHSSNMATGVCMAFTSALIPELQSEDSEIRATDAECAWLASTVALTVPIGAVLSGFLMEHLGRLLSLQLTMLPLCISWIITATAPNFTALIIGRVIMGTMAGIIASSSNVIIAETALKKYRGALSSSGTCLASFGVLCGYTIGAIFDWRTSAWVSVVSPLIPFTLICLFTAESPIWLRSRGRTQKAEKASLYYYGDPHYVVQGSAVPQTIPPLQNDVDVEKKAAQKKEEPVKASFFQQLWILFSYPSGYKPLIILNTVFLLQQWTGIYITLYYAVSFFQAAGSTVDPYLATIAVGLMRFLAGALTIFLMRTCKRRILMLISSLGMAATMTISAYSTSLNLAEQDGGDESILPSWLPVACIIFYILVASIGLQTIPWSMCAELFPQRVRGTAQATNMFISHVFMFATLQAYPALDYYLGGSVGVQYFFAGSSVLAAIIIWIFFPETHGKTLSEIEEYFAHNTIYLGHKK